MCIRCVGNKAPMFSGYEWNIEDIENMWNMWNPLIRESRLIGFGRPSVKPRVKE